MNQTLSVLIVLLTFTGLSFADRPVNNLTEAEKRAGWQLLFDGTSTDGWRNYRQDDINDGWKVRDGAITWVKRGAGDIITRDQFEHFELSLEYRISKGGNSGIMFHVAESGNASYHTGPEIQVQDNMSGHDPQKSGWLYQLYKSTKPNWQYEYENEIGQSAPEVLDATRPAGEWNHVYLRVASQGEVVVNGVHYYYFRKGSDEWNQLVAKSKFAKWPEFGKPTKGHICLQDHGNEVAYRNIKVRPISADGYHKQPIDGELAVKGVAAFPQLKWEGWQSAEDTGKYRSTRPMALTHAGDGSNRLFVAMQSGAIYTIKNASTTKTAKLFLDLRGKVMDWNDGFVKNEEGLLGLALHPKFKSNGKFFVYYTPNDKPRRTIVSRFDVSDDPNKADPNSEQILLDVPQPFPNHNGGSLVFGPDGFLYIGFGDGGLRNDHLGLAQDLSSLHGSIARIDVDQTEQGKSYGIPIDNPFVNTPNAHPETYAYGFRNIWRMSFDRKTGKLWAADVGQDLLEEINIVSRGGNYGWSMREGTNFFGNRDIKMHGSPIDPVWEYDHQIGRSITGGIVYRGSKIPLLEGHYLYADYVAGRIWALEFDELSGRVVNNLAIPSGKTLVLAFGEDEQGEAYYMTESIRGQSIFRLVAAQ